MSNDDDEVANKHGTGRDDAHNAGVTKVPEERACPHDDEEDESPDGGAEGVIEGVDGGGAGVAVKTHDEDVVESEAGEAVRGGEGGQLLADDEENRLVVPPNSRGEPCGTGLSAEVVSDVGNVTNAT
jgi:hypothetical protein